MPRRSEWLRQPRLWLEAFVLANLAGLGFDIYLAHSINRFAHPAEYVPLYFSLAAPVVLAASLVAREALGQDSVWRDLGYLVGWSAVGIGLVGVILHLDSRFFYERTIKSLVYAAPFAAPLAYTGLGLLLIMNRMVPADSPEWPRWVLLLSLGGFVGNFVFSLTDHAQNGFYHATEWIPVVSSAFTVGFLLTPFLTPVGRRFLNLCVIVLAVQCLVGFLGFYLHTTAAVHAPSADWFERIISSAPPLAPLLFPNLALLVWIGVHGLTAHLSAGTLPTETERDIGLLAANSVGEAPPIKEPAHHVPNP